MAGRSLTISDGGSLVFEEAKETGTFKATIIVDNLTANRTLHIPDVDGVLTGLTPGDTWKVNQGGTGLASVPANRIPVGSGSDTSLALIEAPVTSNTFLFWDGVLNQFHWAPVNYQANATTARNIRSDAPGVYSHVIGSELQFRNIKQGTGITVTQNTSDVTIALNPNDLYITAANFSGQLPIRSGGTGLGNVALNEILVGPTSGDAMARVPAPNKSGQFLGYVGTTIAWVPVSFIDSLPGHLEVPRNKTYMLNVRWPFPAKLLSIYGYTVSATTAASKASFVVLVNSTSAQTGTFTNTKPTAVSAIGPVGGTDIAEGDELKLALSSVTNVSDLYFVINYSR